MKVNNPVFGVWQYNVPKQNVGADRCDICGRWLTPKAFYVKSELSSTLLCNKCFGSGMKSFHETIKGLMR